MSFSAAFLRALLEHHTPQAARGMMVALSGGADSACLLTAMARLDPPFRGLPLRAVHVDHGLQAAAADFRVACEGLCRRLGIPLLTIAVTVPAVPGGSLEAQARSARYAALGAQLQIGECLVTAHHAEDQAETLLLQLLRGAGLKGLSAMPACRSWRGGWHVRPLLELSQAELREYGLAAGVDAIDDPMNHEPRFDRAYLRAQLWPLIEARWPGAAASLSRTARHLAQAQEILDESAARRVEALRDGATLSVTGLRLLPRAEQINTLRYWIAAADVALPSTARLLEALRQVMAAAPDQQPAVVWGDHALRRYRDRLFLTAAIAPHLGTEREWRVSAGSGSLLLGAQLGTLHWARRRGALDHSRLPDVLMVRQRRGGETLQPYPGAARQSLQHLCQGLGVLPWMRDTLPMVYAGTELIAVGNLWLDARWCVAATDFGLACEWSDSPNLV